MADRFMHIIVPNFATTVGAQVQGFYTAGTVVSTMPAANLLTDEPSERNRLATHDPRDTYWMLEFGNGSPATITREVQGFGLVNVNLSRFGMYRVLADPGVRVNPQTTFTQRLAPSALLASTNLSGAATDVDESPRSPDGLWNTPTTPGVEWSGRWSFPTPTVTPATGAFRQCFVLWVRSFGNTTQCPVVNVHLYEGGVFRADLGTKVVSNAGGQILIFRWNASLLTSPSGVDAEIQIRASGNVLLGNGVDLGAMAWDAEKSSPVTTHDSGWLPSPFDSLSADFGNTSGALAGLEPTRNLSFFPPPGSSWTTRWWIFAFSDDQADDSLTYSATAMRASTEIKAPEGYAQAGVAPAGPAFTPSLVNFAKGPLVSVRDPSVQTFTLGGQDSGSRRRPRRVMPVTLSMLSEDQGFALFDRLDWRLGKKLPVLVVKYPDSPGSTSRHTTQWMTLEEMPGLAVPRVSQLSWSGVFVEKL